MLSLRSNIANHFANELDGMNGNQVGSTHAFYRIAPTKPGKTKQLGTCQDEHHKSRKPLSLMGSQGSNPCLSAIILSTTVSQQGGCRQNSQLLRPFRNEAVDPLIS